MRESKSKILAKSALCGALYAALTILIYPLSYGMVQVRFSEVMTLLAFYNPSFVPGLLVGCFIANLLGAGGLIDAIFGTLASAFAFWWIVKARKIKNKTLGLFIAGLGPVVSAFIIAFELRFALHSEEAFWLWFLWVAAGQFVAVEVFGFPIFKVISKNKKFMNLIK